MPLVNILKKLSVKILGNDELHHADVFYRNPFNRLAVDGMVEAYDNITDCWFEVNVSGNIGDTIVVHIEGISPDIVVTLTAIEAGDEEKTAEKVVNILNANIDFREHWRAKKVLDNAVVHISSIHIGEEGEKLNDGDFDVYATGATVVTPFQDKIERKLKFVSISRDSRDPRYGILGISGEVQTTSKELADIFIDYVRHLGATSLLVDGSVTPVNFRYEADLDQDTYIQEIRIYGQANGIKFGQFYAKPVALPKGIELSIKSNDRTTVFPLIKTTEDILHKFSSPMSEFSVTLQPGLDDAGAARNFPNPFVLKKAGTFVIDDYIQVKIQDNLTSGLYLLECLLSGFKQDA